MRSGLPGHAPRRLRVRRDQRRQLRAGLPGAGGRATAAFRSFVSVQGSLAMFPIHAYGSEEQKQEWLPAMAAGEAIGCFGLTEPDSGSDPSSMRTRARRDGDDWVLNGTKMWITNGGVADVAVIWAVTDDGVRGFVVPTDTPGFVANDIHRKLSLRASVTSELVLTDVRAPGVGACSPAWPACAGPLSCLSEARFGIVFGAVGAARACYEAALAYATRAPPVRPAARRLPARPAQAGGDAGAGATGPASWPCTSAG